MTDDERSDGREQPVDSPTEAESLTVDSPPAGSGLVEGAEIGGRYRIRSRLGAGGMGEVWQAFDLKLRVEVALKALRENLFRSEGRLELLRQEVRAAREVMSPNVCRIFDLVEAEGRELVSMEYVDGHTLLEVLKDRGPLELKEAQDIASQFLAGLEAIHAAGLIHRDVKPENIMITRAGRVVLMDFGLARQEDSGAGSVAGTPAYMAPEQAAGKEIDARADVYSAGVVLAEMVSPGGVKDLDSRKSLWVAVRSEPPQLPDSPWAPVIKRAVARDREQRYHSAHTLTRALEEVTQRVAGAEDLRPYPGLASFTESDAEYFFGREAEVEQMWRRLTGAPRLLAIAGPSGAGKTSFLRAGLVPSAPPGWGILRCTPGNAAISSLATAVARETAGDPDTVALLPRFDDPDVAVEVLTRWGRSRDRSLLIVDQFEELFTLNPVEEQQRFAALLGRLALSAEVHVLLSLRDDFLGQCNRLEPLRPIFHELTMLDPPEGANLRRALVQPATKCGYRFEDDELVEEMLAEVEGERGALPLLAFAAARLWEKRDRDTGLMTRQAHDDIGGVGGALARHAEATLDRIGAERLPIVRELFRNLVTADGTRAVREVDELLSVFDEPEREAAVEVLRELIDARLLTSYEIQEEDREPTRRVEIIHESLLANWPRLVRWQTQDVDAAQLRDELRQAAASWDDHGRPDDRLWTGSAFREFTVWRERYPGGLTDVEASFSKAMTSFATRRRRRQRLAVAAAFSILMIVLAVVGTLWQRSVRETRRAEAAKLLALGEVELENFPTSALAWALASLELADTLEARLLALRALSEGPPVTVCPLDVDGGYAAAGLQISPDGRWIASGFTRYELRFHDGSEPIPIELPEPGGFQMAFAPDDVLITRQNRIFRWWALPNMSEPIRTQELDGGLAAVRGGSVFGFYHEEGTLHLHRRPVDGGPGSVVGSMPADGISHTAFSAEGSRVAYNRGNRILVRSLDDWDLAPRVIGEHDAEIKRIVIDPNGESVAVWDTTGVLRIWATDGASSEPLRTMGETNLGGMSLGNPVFDRRGMWLAGWECDPACGNARLFDLDAPQGALGLLLKRADDEYLNSLGFHPSGDWFVGGNFGSLGFWPLTRPYPWVLEHAGRVMNVAFTPDSSWLITTTSDSIGEMSFSLVRAWPLRGQNNGEPRVLGEFGNLALYHGDLEIDPSGELVAVSNFPSGNVWLMSLAGDRHEQLDNPDGTKASSDLLSFSPDGRYLAAAPAQAYFGAGGTIRVWDLESGEGRIVATVDGRAVELSFVDDRHLRWAGTSVANEDIGGGERIIDLENGSMEVVSEDRLEFNRAAGSSGEFVVSTILVGGNQHVPATEIRSTDRTTGETQRITSHGSNATSITLDPTERWMVTGGYLDYVVRVGPVTGEEPHLLFGHGGQVPSVAVSPDGHWIASASYDNTARLWPMPDMSKPPMHTLPHDELIAKLKSLTNVRVVRDEESATGWKLEVGPFPGWETVPDW